MSDESRLTKQDHRKRQILSATLRLLRRHGAGITTAQIAAEAHCSKETLYNWFGDRDGIMMALVQEQARGMKQALDVGFRSGSSANLERRLITHATYLLDILTGEAILAVNRVAMAQACRERSDLGNAVLQDWRAQVAKPFIALFNEGHGSGELAISDANEAFECFLGLLIGDRQRRLLLGQDTRPEASEMAAIATTAVQRWLKLYTAED